MKVLGVDPASARSGIALLDGERLVHSEQWTVTRALALPTNLAMFAARISILIHELEVELVRIERVHSVQNLDTVRKIAYFEAAAMIAAAGRAEVEQMGISRARKLALGDGSLRKEAAAEIIRARYGEQLSLDECDAITVALAIEEGGER